MLIRCWLEKPVLESTSSPLAKLPVPLSHRICACFVVCICNFECVRRAEAEVNAPSRQLSSSMQARSYMNNMLLPFGKKKKKKSQVCCGSWHCT